MKRFKALFIMLSLTMVLSSCGSKSIKTDTEKVNDAASNQQETVQATQNKDTENNSKPIAEDASKQTQAQPAKENNANASNTTTNTDTNKSNSTATSPVVKNNKVIVIDPGHANRSNLEKEPLSPGSSEMKIKDGGGAQGVATRVPEYKIAMSVSVKLKALLEARGYTVVMTKTQDSQSLGNVERAEIWNKSNAALAIRIHADSSESSSVKGASMLVPAPINEGTKAIYSASKKYGQTVLNTLVSQVGMQNRGVTEHNDMTGFNWSKVPVILVEMGFLSNPDEDKLLASEPYQDKVAKALADGIDTAMK